MKTHKNIIRKFAAAAAIAILSLAVIASAQITPKPIEGFWQGTLGAGANKLRIIVSISKSPDGSYNGSLESVDQDVTLPVSNIKLENNSVQFELKEIGGVYKGTLSADGTSLTGTWTQTGVPAQPLKFTWSATKPQTAPDPTVVPAAPPVPLSGLQTALDRALAPVLDHGVLAKSTGGGIVIGVYDHGQSRVFAFGTAQPDSMFEIGSLTKTFTGLILAQMVLQKKVSFDDPVRTLLPDGTVIKPLGAEITLLDLATQHSGLPRMPDNFHPANIANPYVDYHAAQMYAYMNKHGVGRANDTIFLYSNFGFGLLGQTLSVRAGIPYGELVKNEVTGPLHMDDTGLTLSPTQQARLIQGHDAQNHPAGRWDFDAFAGAGALVSTGADMLKYLEANLHPEKTSSNGGGNAASAVDSPSATLPAALAQDHQLRASGIGPTKVALAWVYNEQTKIYFHDGGTGGYSSFAAFIPTDDRAVVVLYNRSDVSTANPLAQSIFFNIVGLMTGQPTVKLDQQ
jgi:D-alanyl-D-alanine-carboxypeptidase/D-alanyl-D-alanine-endopeptidase